MTESPRTYEIQEVAELTGLTTARLRAWERRYDVVRPERQENGYRAYTAAQVALLRAFGRLVRAGERIGEIAAQPRDEVLARAEIADGDESPVSPFIEAIRGYDRARLEELVADRLRTLGPERFAREIVLPLATQVGDLWSLGKLPIASEHLASEVVLHALKGALSTSAGNGPLLIASGLPGERHEWGLLATLAQAQGAGWRVQYLGPDLPLREVIQAAWTIRPAAVALSASNVELLERRLPELNHFVSHLPPGVRAVIGGRGAVTAGAVLPRLGFELELGPPRRSPAAEAAV